MLGVQNSMSIRHTKACWLVNKDLELTIVTEGTGIKVASRYLASGRVTAMRQGYFRVSLVGHMNTFVGFHNRWWSSNLETLKDSDLQKACQKAESQMTCQLGALPACLQNGDSVNLDN